MTFVGSLLFLYFCLFADSFLYPFVSRDSIWTSVVTRDCDVFKNNTLRPGLVILQFVLEMLLSVNCVDSRNGSDFNEQNNFHK